MEDLDRQLINPYKEGKPVCYRGERVDSLARPLLPTLFRNRNALIPEGRHFVDIDADFLLKFYSGNGRYVELFNQVFGRADRYHMYNICAFSQHYMNCSPLIDLTKSPYVALSFALKGKKETSDDAILYTVEVPNEDNYTNDPVVAECWLREYHVSIYNKNVDSEGRKIECTSPSA